FESYETYYGVGNTINANEQWGITEGNSNSISYEILSFSTNPSTSPNAHLAVIVNNYTGSPYWTYGGVLIAKNTSWTPFASQYTTIDQFSPRTNSSAIISFNNRVFDLYVNSGALKSGYIGFYVSSATPGATIATVHWIRTRIFPPNNVMPSVSFGPVQIP
ncbi:MAG: hypothetical protein QXR73_03975, partial [Candidatus Micrarchaeaceae archaeon]